MSMGANGEVSADVVKYISMYMGRGPRRQQSVAQYTTFRSGHGISQTNLSGHAQHTCLLISGGRVRGALSRICVSLPCAFWLSQVEDEVESEAKVLEVED